MKFARPLVHRPSVLASADVYQAVTAFCRIAAPLRVIFIALWLGVFTSNVSAAGVTSLAVPEQTLGKRENGSLGILSKAAPILSAERPIARFSLGPPDLATLQSELSRQSPDDSATSNAISGREKVGFGRQVPEEMIAQFEAFVMEETNWVSSFSGKSIAFELSSDSAMAMRAQLHIKGLTKSAILSFSGTNGQVIYQTSWKEILSRHGEIESGELKFWTPIIESDAARVEIFLPAGSTVDPATLISVSGASHLGYSPETEEWDSRLFGIGSSFSCQRDAVCDSVWNIQRKATAMLYATSAGGSTFQESAIVLNNTREDFTPYMLVEGWINSSSEAASINTRWRFEASTCDGGLGSGSSWLYGGASFLASHSPTYQSLVVLNEDLLSGTGLSGWTSGTNVLKDSLSTIHHPVEDLKKIASGYNAAFAACIPRNDGTGNVDCYDRSSSASDANFIKLQFTRGTAEQGSWGAGVFDSQKYLIGNIYTRNTGASCSALYYSYVGRFDRAYSTFAPYINNPGGGEGWITIPLGETIEGINIALGAVARYRATLPEGVDALTVETFGGSGDADLTVGFSPTGTSCSSEQGSNTETCTLFSPPAGDVYITISGYSRVSDLSLRTQITGDEIWQPLVLEEIKTGVSRDQSKSALFRVRVPQGIAKLRIDSFAGSGDPDLFVGEGYEPIPYKNYDCISDNEGTTERCELDLPFGTYYVNLFAFSSFSNISVVARGLSAPDRPVARAEGRNGSARITFSPPDDNGAPIQSYSASCTLQDALMFASDPALSPRASDGQAEVKASGTQFVLSESKSRDLPGEYSVPEGAILLDSAASLRNAAPGDEVLLSAFGHELRLLVARATTTSRGNRYLVGETPDEQSFHLMVSAEGLVLGRVELPNDLLMLSPEPKLSRILLRSAQEGMLRQHPFGDDARVDPAPVDPDRQYQPMQAGSSSSNIAVLALYDPDLPDAEVTVDYLLQYTNTIQQASGTGITFIETSMRPYTPSGSPLDDITDSSTIAAWREQERADLVIWVGDFTTQYGYCGVAWVPGANGGDYASRVKDLGYSVTLYGASGGYYCTDETLAHELGHNLGAAHDRANSSLRPYYAYAYGDGTNGIFGTVMSYLSPEIGKYSSPLLSCPTRACGIADYTDVVRAINNVRETVAGIFEGGPGTSGITPGVRFGGTVNPSSRQIVSVGSVMEFTFVPNVGYQLDGVEGDCVGSISGNVYSVTAGEEDCEFEGLFRPSGKSFQVNVSATSGGSVSPSGLFSITPNYSLPIVATPEPDFALAAVGGSCGGLFDAETATFETNAIVSNCSVRARFALANAGITGSDSPLMVSGLTNGSTYACSVVAANEFGISQPSAPVLVTPDTTAPSSPRITKIESADGELIVYFSPGDTGGLPVKYQVDCSPSDEDAGSSVIVSGSPAVVSNLENGQEYSCRVFASNAKGTVWSNVLSATPEEQPTGLPIWLLYQATQ